MLLYYTWGPGLLNGQRGRTYWLEHATCYRRHLCIYVERLADWLAETPLKLVYCNTTISLNLNLKTEGTMPYQTILKLNQLSCYQPTIKLNISSIVFAYHVTWMSSSSSFYSHRVCDVIYPVMQRQWRLCDLHIIFKCLVIILIIMEQRVKHVNNVVILGTIWPILCGNVLLGLPIIYKEKN